jgi:D-alanine-D-alanine ligase
MKVTVLFGGPSAERAVSLMSGRAVIDGLRSAGHDVYGCDISPDNLSGLDHPADVIFPVLHGRFGESGELQEILERRGSKFVGSGSAASRLGMDKVATKRVWERAGLPTPAYKVLSRVDWSASKCVTAPSVVKAVDSGSSIDVYVCQTSQEAAQAVDSVLSFHERVLVEQYIHGPELTIGILAEQPLAPIHIVPKRAFFDYEAKYSAPDTEHRFDTGLPVAVVKRCQELATRANEIVGARDLARVDIMLDSGHNPYLLEINTLPGFTPKSLLPEAANHAGIDFVQLVDGLVTRAFSRRKAA